MVVAWVIHKLFFTCAARMVCITTHEVRCTHQSPVVSRACMCFGRRTWVRAIFELHEVELRFSL
jgi:hypothetical protein